MTTELNRESLFFAALAFLLSLVFVYSPGTSDVKEDLRWITNAEEFGLRAGYVENGDSYPPLIPTFLYYVSKIARSLNLSAFAGLKLSLFLFLYLTAIVFYLVTKNLFLTSTMTLAFILNSVALCYLDIFLTPTLLLAYFALARNRLTTFSVFFTVSCLIKFQPLILLPPIVIYFLNVSDFRKLVLRVILPASAIVLIFVLIFRLEMFMALARALFYHHQLSANAANLNWLLTFILHITKPEQFGPLVEGRVDFIRTVDPKFWLPSKIFFIVAYLWSLRQFTKQKKSFENMLLFSLIGYFIYFTFNTGVHENHLFPAMVLAFLICWKNKTFIRNCAVISLIANLNMLLFYGIHGAGLPFSRVVGMDLSVLLAAVVVVFCLIFWRNSVSIVRKPL